MKRHIKGTNNRTFCGNVINDKTVLVDPVVPPFMSDCRRCLGRLSDDINESVGCMILLHAICKDSAVLHKVTKLYNIQLKQRAKAKEQYKKDNPSEKRN